MFKLFKLNDESYVILYSNGVEFEANKTRIIIQLFMDGVEEQEIFNGFEALDSGYDMADYGVNKTMIYSKKLVA